MNTLQSTSSKDLRSLFPVLHFIKPYLWVVLGASFALIFTAGITLSIGQGLRLLIDDGFAIGSSALLNRSIGILGIMIFFMATGTYLRYFLVSWLGERVSADIRKAIFNHVIMLHPSFFETNQSGEIQSRITTDTTLLETVIGSSISVALRNMFMFVGGVIWLFITNPKLTSIVLLCVPLVVGPILFLGRRVRRLSKNTQDHIASVGTYVSETIKNIKTVQAYNHQPQDQAIFSETVEATFSVAIRRVHQRAFLIFIVISLVFSAIAAMLWVGGQDVLKGQISGGELAAFVFYAVVVASAVGSISEVYGDLQRAAGATERIGELLQVKSLITAPSYSVPLAQMPQGKLNIRKLRFYYPSRPETPAIDGIDFSIEAGKSIALVGPSGAGKSTLFDLLLRFYDPQQGQIQLDGVNIRDLDPRELRKHIAIVPQQPAIFSGNVLENIRYGDFQASMKQIREATKAAYAHEFIENLPENYHSYLGESGVRLSGGQSQRIAIARAILKNSEILLLDEATSALDAESELMVQKALEKLMRNRTTLIIAHRLATVINADQIVVLDQGKIVAIGTHQELLQTSPLYARLAKLQFQGC